MLVRRHVAAGTGDQSGHVDDARTIELTSHPDVPFRDNREHDRLRRRSKLSAGASPSAATAMETQIVSIFVLTVGQTRLSYRQ